MKAVRDQYTVEAKYEETYKHNIRKIMEDVREIANPGIKYSA